MKSKMKAACVSVALLAGTTLAGIANAADGQINFTGQVLDAACTVTPGTATQTADLGEVNRTSLAAAGDTASSTSFDIVLTTCPAAAATATVKFDGATNGGNSDLLALTTVTGMATGVGIGIYEDDSSTLIPIGSNSKSKTLSTDVNTTFTFIAKYVATAAATGGAADASTDFTVIYN